MRRAAACRAGAEALPGPEPRKAARERQQRDRVSGDRTAVDPVPALIQSFPDDVLDRRLDLALHEMLRRLVAGGVDAARAGEADETRMFARAIVVQRRRRAARARERPRRLAAQRPMRAAGENGNVRPRLGEHRARERHVGRLARMRGAAQRDRLPAQPKPIRGAALDQRQRLQRLDRRARKYRPGHVAEREDHTPVGVDDRPRPAMKRLDARAAGDFDDDGVVHVSSKPARSRQRG